MDWMPSSNSMFSFKNRFSLSPTDAVISLYEFYKRFHLQFVNIIKSCLEDTLAEEF